MSNIINVPFTRTEDQRQRALFAWADRALCELGFIDRIAQASSLIELRQVTFDPDAADVALAIRNALHPTSGSKDSIFDHLRAGTLKRILKNRFDTAKSDREAELRRYGGRQSGTQSAPDWTDKLKFDDGGRTRPILSNCILFLLHHSAWEGVLGFDEFNA